MAVTFSQTGRTLALTTPLGTDKLLLERFHGREGISELYRFTVDALCLVSNVWTFDQLLGQSVTMTVQLPNNQSRYLNGIVSRIVQAEHVTGVLGADTFVRYRLDVVPKLWLLTRKFQSRIFQQMSVPDILKQVLTGLDVSWQIQGTFDPRDYCTQYHETDFAFACRLMEEEGIYYYFKHSNGSHQMVVANSPQSHADVPGATSLSYQPTEGGVHPDDRILVWTKSQEVRSGKVTLWDHCFELPGKNLEAVQSSPPPISVGTVAHKQQVASNDQMEIYEYPGLYAQRFDGVAPGGGDRASDVQKIFQDNTRTAGIRLREELTPGLNIDGEGNVRNLQSGCKFTLTDHFDGNGDYVVTQVEYAATQEGVYTLSAPPTPVFQCRFRCIPAALPYSPPRTTPRPRIAGPQSAVVVGPSGNEIFTDKYGRVKVQFAWDRQGTNDASSSCWIRVGSIWAGKQWGGIFIPRIGHEVVVVFEEGDPDRPIIVGSVYNSDNMPPYTLPDNATQSGIKTQSTTQGTADEFNELRFEDKKGSEDIYFQAQKDFHRYVKNDDDLKVDHDQTITIKNDRTETVSEGNETVTIAKGDRKVEVQQGNDTHLIDKGNRSVEVQEGNDSHLITKGNRSVEVQTGTDTLTVKGNRTTTIQQGNDALTLNQGNLTITLDSGSATLKASSGSVTIEGMQSIELKVGSNSIQISQQGITISGMQVSISGQSQVEVKGPMTQVNASGILTLKGSLTQIN